VVIVNFAHPVTETQKSKIEQLARQTVRRIIDVPAQFEDGAGFAEQARALIDAVGLSAEDWQTHPLLVVLPSLSIIAALVLAEIHGRVGHFPAVLRMRPAPIAIRQFEAAEILDLQAIRDTARRTRTGKDRRGQ
jgi:hypothetical protein